MVYAIPLITMAMPFCDIGFRSRLYTVDMTALSVRWIVNKQIAIACKAAVWQGFTAQARDAK